MIIGLIGKVGSGKSLCANYLKHKYDAIVYSCDDVAKDIMSKEKDFYNKYSNDNVFTNENLQEFFRTKLHNLVFNRIDEDILNFKSKCSNNYQLFVIESALPNDEMFKICDKVIHIDVEQNRRINLLEMNRNYNREKIDNILNAQKYYEEFYDKADYKIENNGEKVDLEKKIDEVINEIYINRK